MSTAALAWCAVGDTGGSTSHAGGQVSRTAGAAPTAGARGRNAGRTRTAQLMMRPLGAREKQIGELAEPHVEKAVQVMIDALDGKTVSPVQMGAAKQIVAWAEKLDKDLAIEIPVEGEKGDGHTEIITFTASSAEEVQERINQVLP